MQSPKEKGKGFTVPPLVLGGAETALLFLPVIFMTAPLMQIADSQALMGLITVLPPAVSAILGCFAIFDRSARQAMLKWILSLPFSAVFWVYFVNSRFLIRMYNYIDPSFGDGGDGVGAGLTIVLSAALFAGGIGVAAGMFLSQHTPSEKIRKTALLVQKTVCPAVCAIILITVIILGIIMPDYTG